MRARGGRSRIAVSQRRLGRRFRIAPVSLILVLLSSLAVPGQAYDPGRVSFSIRFKNERTSLGTLAVFVLPEERLSFEIEGSAREQGDRPFFFRPSAGIVLKDGPRSWDWRSPEEPGLYPIRLGRGDETMLLNVFVMVPAGRIEGEFLLGYRLGTYPTTPLRGLSAYQRPRGFVAVTPELAQAKVSPHFVLGQFVCKQESGYPKMLVLRERLLRKLELLLEELNRSGHPAETLFIMSGYRTPYYNRAIGNVKYSRHIYGDAADIFVDEDGDGHMDDLNGDGNRDHQDAGILHDLVESMFGRASYEPLVGGLSLYRAKPPIRGPFVHIDTRGFKARW